MRHDLSSDKIRAVRPISMPPSIPLWYGVQRKMRSRPLIFAMRDDADPYKTERSMKLNLGTSTSTGAVKAPK
jgi:hypothetical protein